MARMIGATLSGLFWIIWCVCALFFGREGLVMEAKALYGVRLRPPEQQPAMTDAQRQAAEKLIAEYLAAAEAERQPVVDELKKLGDGGQFVLEQKVNAARQAFMIAQAAAKKAEAEGKTDETAKLRAEAEKAAAQNSVLTRLLNVISAGAVQPRPETSKDKYGVRARE